MSPSLFEDSLSFVLETGHGKRDPFRKRCEYFPVSSLARVPKRFPPTTASVLSDVVVVLI